MNNLAYESRVERVQSPGVVHVQLRIGFGVFITRLLNVANAPKAPAKKREAIHALVTLVGGKRVIVITDPSTTHGDISGNLLVEAKNVPPDCAYIHNDVTLLDVGRFLESISPEFRHSDVLNALNGSGALV